MGMNSVVECVWKGEKPFLSDVAIEGVYDFEQFMRKVREKRLEKKGFGDKSFPKKDEFETKSEHDERVKAYLVENRKRFAEINMEINNSISAMINTYLNQKKIEMFYNAELEVFTISLSCRLFDVDFRADVPREFAKEFKNHAKKMEFNIEYKRNTKSLTLTHAHLSLPKKEFTIPINFSIDKEERRIKEFFRWVKKHKLESKFKLPENKEYYKYLNPKKVLEVEPWREIRERKEFYLSHTKIRIAEIQIFKDFRNIENITLKYNRFLLKTDSILLSLFIALVLYLIFLMATNIETAFSIIALSPIFLFAGFFLIPLFLVLFYLVVKLLESIINGFRQMEVDHHIKKFRNAKTITVEYDKRSLYGDYFNAFYEKYFRWKV